MTVISQDSGEFNQHNRRLDLIYISKRQNELEKKIDKKRHLLMAGFSDVEKFTPEGENTVTIATDNTESSYSQRLGRVSLSQDQRTIQGVFSSGIIRILQFRDTCNNRRSILFL